MYFVKKHMVILVGIYSKQKYDKDKWQWKTIVQCESGHL